MERDRRPPSNAAPERDRLDSVQLFFGGGILNLRPRPVRRHESARRSVEQALGVPVRILRPGEGDLRHLFKSRFGPLFRADLPSRPAAGGTSPSDVLAGTGWPDILGFTDYRLHLWIAEPAVLVLDIVNRSDGWSARGADVVARLWEAVHLLSRPQTSSEIGRRILPHVGALTASLQAGLDKGHTEAALLYEPQLLFVHHTWSTPDRISPSPSGYGRDGSVLVHLTRGEFLAMWDGCRFWDSGVEVESYRPGLADEVRIMDVLAGIRYTQAYFAERCAYELCQEMRMEPGKALKASEHVIRETRLFLAWLDTATKSRFLSTEQDHVNIGQALLEAWKTPELLDNARPSASTIEVLHASFSSKITRRVGRVLERMMIVLTAAGLYQAVDLALVKCEAGQSANAFQSLFIAIAIIATTALVFAWLELRDMYR